MTANQLNFTDLDLESTVFGIIRREKSMNMYKFNILLFFLIFEFTCFAKAEEPEELYEETIEEKDAEQSLHKIEPGKALPLVLFRNRSKRLFLPTNLHKVRSLYGKMIQGTEFTITLKDVDQMFFCPKSDTEECLVGTPFKGSEALQCTSEPTPVTESENTECGNDKIGLLNKFGYQICRGQDRIDTDVIPFYRYCYDKNLQKTLFTVHMIQSPALLTAKLLLREREVTYPMMMDDGTTVSIERGPDDKEVYEPSTSKLSSPKPGYQWKQFVHTKDMTLALWRKPTFHEINLALQHEKLIKIWDNIGEYVRSNAIQSFTKDELHTVVYTGVVDLKSVSGIKNGDQLSNIWVKLILTTSSKLGLTSYAKQGVAIFMNNFIDTETSNSKSSNSDGIEGYCDQDICTESLKDQFKNVNGNVRCCSVTKKILDLFNHKHIELEELRIPKVNFGEDQEILEDDDEKNNIPEEQPVESLREIQQHEILPIILYLYLNRGDFRFFFPDEVQQIITKNKRIVDGSQFTLEDIKNQLLFCPKEDANETCLVPRKFGRYEPLQCTKLPVPVIKQVTDDDGQEIRCGAGGNGTLYKVVYKMCTDNIPDYEYKATNMTFYKFCYDSTKQKILYTHHEQLSSKLLNSRLLFWERKIEFPMPTDTQLPLVNLEDLLEAMKEENENSTSPTDTKKSVYKLQRLVPSEDMAFASWKIPTNLLVNVAFQHKSLISFWKGINRNVKDYMKTLKSINVFIYNGVLDIPRPTTSLGADQKSQMWFKIIHTKHWYHNENGIVILMQDFLTLKSDPAIPSNYEENTLKQYCDDNLCLNEFQNKFKEIGGQVRCCRLTTKIAQTFGIPNVGEDNEVLSIPDIISRISDDDRTNDE